MDSLLRLTSVVQLNAILERAGVLGGARVRDVTIISDRPILVSRITRLRLVCDAPADALPNSLIVKTGLTEFQESEWSGQQEVAFYADVAPTRPAALVPHCFEAQPADATTPSHLVLEDLTDTHGLAPEAPVPPSDAQCRTIVGSLARLHAGCWWYPPPGFTIDARSYEASVGEVIGQVAQHLEVFVARLGDELSGERRGFYERLIKSSSSKRP